MTSEIKMYLKHFIPSLISFGLLTRTLHTPLQVDSQIAGGTQRTPTKALPPWTHPSKEKTAGGQVQTCHLLPKDSAYHPAGSSSHELQHQRLQSNSEACTALHFIKHLSEDRTQVRTGSRVIRGEAPSHHKKCPCTVPTGKLNGDQEPK